VIIVGAGLAGLAAAHELRHRDLLVLEASDRVGGRAFSGSHKEYWFNSGAQFVWDRRTLGLCAALGLDVLGAKGARSGIFIRGRLVSAATPYGLVLKMPLTLAERVDLARTILRLRRIAATSTMADALRFDQMTLDELIGKVTPVTREILDSVCENGTGLGLAEVSAWIGLGYSIHLFGGDVSSTLKMVKGGTQAIANRIADLIPRDRLLLNSRVLSVDMRQGGADVQYVSNGELQFARARYVIMALPAPRVLEVVRGLPTPKFDALQRIRNYTHGLTVAWMTDESSVMPWDHLLAVPAIGAAFELFSNNAFGLRSAKDGRQPGGTFVTLSIGRKAREMVSASDDEIRRLHSADLIRMFPGASPVVLGSAVRVERWKALPPFPLGSLRTRAQLRSPFEGMFFCGDYTAQPGTPGAIGSGYHVAESVRNLLGPSLVQAKPLLGEPR